MEVGSAVGGQQHEPEPSRLDINIAFTYGTEIGVIDGNRTRALSSTNSGTTIIQQPP